MAFFSGWFSKGKEVIGRITSGLVEAGRSFFQRRKGQRPTQSAVTPHPDKGITTTPDDISREILEEGKAVTPKGTITIDPQKENKSVSGKIPKSWMDELEFNKAKIVERPPIFGEHYHYKVNFRVLYQTVDENNKVVFDYAEDWVTVTSKEPLTKEQVLSRGVELAGLDYSKKSPALGGVVIGVVSVDPVIYTGK